MWIEPVTFWYRQLVAVVNTCALLFRCLDVAMIDTSLLPVVYYSTVSPATIQLMHSWETLCTKIATYNGKNMTGDSSSDVQSDLMNHLLYFQTPVDSAVWLLWGMLDPIFWTEYHLVRSSGPQLARHTHRTYTPNYRATWPQTVNEKQMLRCVLYMVICQIFSDFENQRLWPV